MFLKENVHYFQLTMFSLWLIKTKFAITVPVTNAWQELSASMVKSIKNKLRSSLKMDFLDQELMNSMNGPWTKANHAKSIIQKVGKRYQPDKQHLKPRLKKVMKETLRDMIIHMVNIIVTEVIKTASDVDSKWWDREVLLPNKFQCKWWSRHNNDNTIHDYDDYYSIQYSFALKIYTGKTLNGIDKRKFIDWTFLWS